MDMIWDIQPVPDPTVTLSDVLSPTPTIGEFFILDGNSDFLASDCDNLTTTPNSNVSDPSHNATKSYPHFYQVSQRIDLHALKL